MVVQAFSLRRIDSEIQKVAEWSYQQQQELKQISQGSIVREGGGWQCGKASHCCYGHLANPKGITDWQSLEQVNYSPRACIFSSVK